MLDIFGITDWPAAMVALLAGTALGFFYGLAPGIGGRTGIILSLPSATLFDPYSAAIFLFSMHAVIHTSSSIPAIAFGYPSSGGDFVTVIDGYPLAKKGRAGEALGASLSASAIGGILGALTFVAAIPVARQLITAFGPPEFLMLALLGLTMVATLSKGGLVAGLVAGGFGIVCAMVGVDFRTGEERFTFGELSLWGGISLPALVSGLFVIPEMLTIRAVDEASHQRAITTTVGDVFRGMWVTFRHLRVLLQSTLNGIVVGLMPAVGSSVSVWLAYSQAARSVKSDVPFGEGAIAGVIAPEAANNSKEGGAMIPTLLFGVPGSSSMAIMIAALSFVGVTVGPNMFGQDIGLSYSLAGTVILSNLIAIPMFFAVIPAIVRLSALRREALVPLAIAIAVTAALAASPEITTILELVVFSAFGIGLKLANWPRAPIILGFVIGVLLETSFYQTSVIWGWSALTRPITAILLVAVVITAIVSFVRADWDKLRGPRLATGIMIAVFAAFFALVAAMAWPLSTQARTFPLLVASSSAILLAIVVVHFFRAHQTTPADPVHFLGAFALFVAATPFLGIIPASFAFVLYVLVRQGYSWWSALLTTVVFCALEFAFVSSVFDVMIEREIIGRIAWAILYR